MLLFVSKVLTKEGRWGIQIALAMKAKLPYSFLCDQIYTLPTMSEAFNDLFK